MTEEARPGLDDKSRIQPYPIGKLTVYMVFSGRETGWMSFLVNTKIDAGFDNQPIRYAG